MGTYILKKNWHTLLTVFLAGMICVLLAGALYQANMYERVSNDLYDGGESRYRYAGGVPADTMQALAGNGLASLHLNEHVRAIYFSHGYELPVVNGRFFSRHEMESGSPVCVAGSGWQEGITVKGGKQYIHFENVEYEVIGTLGLPAATTLDHMLLLPMMRMDTAKFSGTAVFTANNIQIIERMLAAGVLSQFVQYYVAPIGVQAVWASPRVYSAMAAAVACAVLFGLAFQIQMKNRMQAETLRILRVLGFSRQSQLQLIAGTESLLYTGCFTAGLLAGLLFTHATSSLLPGLGSTMLFAAATLATILCANLCTLMATLFSGRGKGANNDQE